MKYFAYTSIEGVNKDSKWLMIHVDRKLTDEKRGFLSSETIGLLNAGDEKSRSLIKEIESLPGVTSCSIYDRMQLWIQVGTVCGVTKILKKALKHLRTHFAPGEAALKCDNKGVVYS